MKHRPALMALVLAAVAAFSVGKSAHNKDVFAAQKASDTTASAPVQLRNTPLTASSSFRSDSAGGSLLAHRQHRTR
jgi:hypothetical protein